MKSKRIIFVAFVIILCVALFFLIETSEKNPPQSVLVFFGDTYENALTNASCKADIITSEAVVENKPLNEIGNIFNKIPGIEIGVKDKSGKGFYELKTEFNSSQDIDNFEIKIVCISKDNKNIGYTIINNTNVPCELIDKGQVLVC
jgi:hypothetical protein